MTFKQVMYEVWATLILNQREKRDACGEYDGREIEYFDYDEVHGVEEE